MNELTQLSLSEKNHRRKLKAIQNAIKAVDRAIKECAYIQELEYAKQNLKLALIRENIDYENRVRFEKEQNK